jgi:1-acyl-sn-glycerol-3-phosphate acyltransferase
MGIALSLRTVWSLARASALTVADSMTGRLTRELTDRRIERFAREVVRSAAIDLAVEGAENVPEGRAFVVMFNHQSHLDIPILYDALPLESIRMVAKTELFKVPIWGRAMRAGGMIEVDRSDRARAIASLRRAGEAIAAGVSIGIAPEGRRTRDGKVGPLKKGGFHLALETGAAILPVAINGSYNILPPETIRMRRDVPVSVLIGEPIEVEGRTVPDLVAELERFFAEHVEPV